MRYENFKNRLDESCEMTDDLSRDLYCVLGIPVDAVNMHSCLDRIKAAVVAKKPFLISTPNLNFLVNSQTGPEFTETLLMSDLCPVDGAPILWIARLLGIAIKNRTAGSDIFDAMKVNYESANPLKVFFFGGKDGVAATACQALNVEQCGVHCVGFLYPGFGSIDLMSDDDTINVINSSDADLLIVSLGAKNGQLWLKKNHRRLSAPVRTHLGAVINFQAGVVKRAPPIVRKVWLEWFWRIWEEPHLWKRYWHDGWVLLRLLFVRVMPIAFGAWRQRLKYSRRGDSLVVTQIDDCDTFTVGLSGPATAQHVGEVTRVLRKALGTKKQILIDFTNTIDVDARMLGLFLMLRKQLKERNGSLIFVGVSPKIMRIFRLYNLEVFFSTESRKWSKFKLRPSIECNLCFCNSRLVQLMKMKKNYGCQCVRRRCVFIERRA